MNTYHIICQKCGKTIGGEYYLKAGLLCSTCEKARLEKRIANTDRHCLLERQYDVLKGSLYG